MKNRRMVLLLAVLLVVLIGGASLLYGMLDEQTESGNLSVTTGTTGGDTSSTTAPSDTSGNASAQAPDFTVYDGDGNAVRLSELRGKPVVLNFWASWCGPCKSEMPDFEEAYTAYGDQLQFMMVNLTDGYRETLVRAQNFIRDSGYTFPAYYDTALEAVDTYGVYSVPVTYFIDADGNIVAQARGALSADSLQQGIDMLIN